MSWGEQTSTMTNVLGRRRAGIRWGPITLLVPPVLIFLILYVTPLGYMVIESLTTEGPSGLRTWTLQNYQKFLGDSYYREIIWRSFRLSLISTLASLILGFAVAYHMNVSGPRERRLLTFLVLLPLMVSLVVRMLGWLIILTPGGVMNMLLRSLGLPPLRLLYTEAAVIVGYVHVFLPFMVLAILTSLRGIDRDLVRAAHNLGATPWRTFQRITLPLSVPGMIAGSFVVFALSISSFVVPTVMGGTRTKVLASLVYEQQIHLSNPTFGATLAFALLILTIAILVVTGRTGERSQFFGTGG